MAQYLINYLTGDTDTIEADTVDEEGYQYTGYVNGKIVAHIPRANVRSIILQDDEAATD
ncbi:hypothetical protein ACF061_00695 [Streptomyces sp. NPDC015220]|uniref:hypothetical protein n=1 Tax=Streptomyces sp. NPDC015220 TaxID=3364947 RepID=UPI0036F9EAA1